MAKLGLFIGALLALSANAFAPVQQQSRVAFAVAQKATAIPEVDSLGNNVAVKNLLEDIERSRLLTQVARSGLLSKASKAGISLSTLEPLLAAAAENPDILILVEASGPEVLPLLPKLLALAPPALPLLATAVTIPPAALQVGALASLGAAAGIVNIIPDETVLDVAAQTLAVAIFGLAVPAASLVGATILGQLKK